MQLENATEKLQSQLEQRSKDLSVKDGVIEKLALELEETRWQLDDVKSRLDGALRLMEEKEAAIDRFEALQQGTEADLLAVREHAILLEEEVAHLTAELDAVQRIADANMDDARRNASSELATQIDSAKKVSVIGLC